VRVSARTHVEVHSSGAFMGFAAVVCATEGVTLGCGVSVTGMEFWSMEVMGAGLGVALSSSGV